MKQKHEGATATVFTGRYASLLRLKDSFEIRIDINNLEEGNLMLQKRIRDRDAKKAIIGIN